MNLEGNLKLKVIPGETPENLAKFVNNWLKYNPVEIKEIKYTAVPVEDRHPYKADTYDTEYCAMILYYEKGKCKVK